MIEILRNAFSAGQVSICLSETDSDFIQIYDCYNCAPGLQRSYIKLNANEPAHFTIKNLANENLCFAAVDNCLVNSAGSKRCDFIIGNSRKLFFVEIKLVKTNQRRVARIDATAQLQSTIRFLQQNANLRDVTIIAVICLRAKSSYPLQTATRGADAVAFKTRLNATLMEGQEAEF